MLMAKNRASRLIAVSILTFVLSFSALSVADAFDFGRLLRKTAKIVGIEALVRHFARPLNDFINKIFLNQKVEHRELTKVVPIISFGERKAVGAAQLSGSVEALASVRAVIQYEDEFSRGKFRVKALVPGDSADPTKFSRVYGVGVTAVIDVEF